MKEQSSAIVYGRTICAKDAEQRWTRGESDHLRRELSEAKRSRELSDAERKLALEQAEGTA